MRFFSLAAALTALALGVSAYNPDCDCSKKGAGGSCSIVKADPDPTKSDLTFIATCGSECKVTVGKNDVEFKYYSSIPKGSELAKEYGLDPWVCHDGLKEAFCIFDWAELQGWERSDLDMISRFWIRVIVTMIHRAGINVPILLGSYVWCLRSYVLPGLGPDLAPVQQLAQKAEQIVIALNTRFPA
ncbi:hypothetical protein SCARD494_10355 [Seiridium cardinale]